MDPIPNTHFNCEVKSLSRGQSAIASAAYCLGEQLYSERDHCWKYPNSDAERVLHTEVLLPPNAPPEYADRQVLWNAAEAAEDRFHGGQVARRFHIALPKELTFEQNVALAREYCQKMFVDQGMCADLYVHEDQGHNPHFHVLLTMRAMDDRGQWLPKSKNVFVLDADGNRIRTDGGDWKREKINTVDWDRRDKMEYWRHEWEVMQNAALEKAGRTERIDMRSYERQGITNKVPGVHLGPAAWAMEKKGVRTELGDQNRLRQSINRMLFTQMKSIAALNEWINELADEIDMQKRLRYPELYLLDDLMDSFEAIDRKYRMEDMRDEKRRREEKEKHAAQTISPETQKLSRFIHTHSLKTLTDLRSYGDSLTDKNAKARAKVKENNRRVRDLQDLLKAEKTILELTPIKEQCDSIHWKKAKEKFQTEHAEELKQLNKARALIKKFKLTLPLDRIAMKAEIEELQAANEALRPECDALQQDINELKEIRAIVDRIAPGAIISRDEEGRESVSEVLESAEERKKLEKKLDESADKVLANAPTPRNNKIEQEYRPDRKRGS